MRDPPAHTHQLLTLKSATNGLYTAEVAANSDEINSESLQQAEETALALYKKALPACYWWAIAEPLLACGISHDALQHWLHRRPTTSKHFQLQSSHILFYYSPGDY